MSLSSFTQTLIPFQECHWKSNGVMDLLRKAVQECSRGMISLVNGVAAGFSSEFSLSLACFDVTADRPVHFILDKPQ